MPPRWIAMAAAPVLFAAACAPATEATPAPPADARPLTESGAHEQRLDDVTQELRDALEPHYGRLEIKAYRLPAGATFSSVATHYQGALANWKAEPALPRRIRAAQGQAWRHGKAVLAIALIDTPVAGAQNDYTVLVVARNS